MVFFKLAGFLYSAKIQGAGFRKFMLALFLSTFTLGKVWELVQLSAYHEEQGQAIIGCSSAFLIYAAIRWIIGNSGLINKIQRLFYWIFVGNLKNDLTGKR